MIKFKFVVFWFLLIKVASVFALSFDKLKDNGFPKINLPDVVNKMGENKLFKNSITGTLAFTKIGKEIFEEFLKIKDFDMSVIRQLLNRNSGSKLYHLYSAYCYGLYMMCKTSNPYEQERVKRVVWNIAIEFSIQNTPRWQTYFRGVLPACIWSSVVIFAAFFGSYLRKNNKKIFEKYSDKIFEFCINIFNSLATKDNGKTA